MKAQFNELPWHDAELKEIIIDRDGSDIVKIVVDWPEYDQTFNSTIEFYDCYGFQADMHFGYSPPDSILEAHFIPESRELESLISRWGKIGIALDHLQQYQIITNTTNSTINIFCAGFRLC